MEKVKRKFFTLLRLLMLDRKLWSGLYINFTRKVRNLYNRIFDYLYIRESLGGIVYSKKLMAYGAFQTESTDYLGLFHAFRKIKITESNVIVDVGCGKGRAILWLLKHHKVDRIFGIELNSEISEQTAKRFEKYNNVKIVQGDAIENIPPEGSIFYLYNPFIGTILESFKGKLEELFYLKKPITIIYHNPIFLTVFLNDPKWTVDFFEFKPVFLRKLLCIRQQDTAIIKLNYSATIVD